jgi:hypothetical protein
MNKMWYFIEEIENYGFNHSFCGKLLERVVL